MSRSPAKRFMPPARVNDDFSDLLPDDDALDVAEDENDYGIALHDALNELASLVEDAVSFMESDILPDWEDSDLLIDGGSDLKREKGRSQVVRTVIRDAIRALKPNMMRVFVNSSAICSFTSANPLDFATSTLAQAQTEYTNQVFWASGGYLALLDVVHNSLSKRTGILKSHQIDHQSEKFFELSNVSADELAALEEMDDITVLSVEADEVTGLLQVEVALRRSQGSQAIDSVNLTEFFVNEGATSPDDAIVIGQRRNITVSKALEMGLEYGDWRELDYYDVEMDTDSGGSAARRGYAKSGKDENPGDDLSNYQFLLTEVYAYFDLEGTGLAQLYRFWLGGTSYKYLDHDRVEENPYSVAQSDPVPGAFFGTSLARILREDQNIQTSMLRAVMDNAHLSNNRRLAVHDSLVNMSDVMNQALGAPIRFRQPGMIQEIGVTSTLGSMLPLMDHLKAMSNDKVGVTNASMGLDPDALQSTNKEAVMNTIQLANGQVELMCRNIAETGLVPAFRKLLRLAMRNRNDQQVVFSNGVPIPVSNSTFYPDMMMKVSVGLGNGTPESRLMGLQQIAAKQEQIIAEYGMSNPICGLTQMMNTIVDMGTILGLGNMGRYFNQVTPEVMAQLDEQARAKAAAAQPEPPSAAIVQAETLRAQAKLGEKQMDDKFLRDKLASDNVRNMLKLVMDDDLKRDQMAQQVQIEQAKITQTNVNQAVIAAQQDKDRGYGMQQQLLNIDARRQERQEQREAEEMAAAQAQAQQAQQAQQTQQAQQPPQQGPV